ncbi:MAG: RHS repeat protein [Nitrospira sp.]|nr:RHS repeat protein [Nitrospira sp.]
MSREPNQLTADANFAYQYDDNCNLTRKTLLVSGNYAQYSYDAENRLTQVQEFAAGNPTAIQTELFTGKRNSECPGKWRIQPRQSWRGLFVQIRMIELDSIKIVRLGNV